MFEVPMLNALKNAQHIVVLTGAGISAESGIPTFRDAQSGLWERYDPATLASPTGYKADKALVWGWYEWRRMAVLKAKPNLGHYAIRDLEKQVEALTLMTQNVDDLHERAGSQHVIHLHGSLHQPRCFVCARLFSFPEGIPDEPADGRRLEPPACLNCGGSIRPGLVWFGLVWFGLVKVYRKPTGQRQKQRSGIAIFCYLSGRRRWYGRLHTYRTWRLNKVQK